MTDTTEAVSSAPEGWDWNNGGRCNNTCKAYWVGKTSCHCSQCHVTFGSISGFDKHLTEKGHVSPESIGLVPVPDSIGHPVWRHPAPEGGYASTVLGKDTTMADTAKTEVQLAREWGRTVPELAPKVGARGRLNPDVLAAYRTYVDQNTSKAEASEAEVTDILQGNAPVVLLESLSGEGDTE